MAGEKRPAIPDCTNVNYERSPELLEQLRRAFAAGRGDQIIQGILEGIKPKAVYFGIEGGQRTAFMIINIDKAIG